MFWLHRQYDFFLKRICEASNPQPAYAISCNRSRVSSDNRLHLTFDLVGAGEGCAEALLAALIAWGGESSGQRLTKITARYPQRLALLVYELGSDPQYIEIPPEIQFDAFSVRNIKTAGLQVNFLSPLIIDTSGRRESKGNMRTTLTAGRFVRAALRRREIFFPNTHLPLSARQHLEAESDTADADKLWQTNLSLTSATYSSTTHQTALAFQGWIGDARWSKASPEMLTLLHFASWAQLGQKTALGFGAIALEPKA
jgi:hypothetical protein